MFHARMHIVLMVLIMFGTNINTDGYCKIYIGFDRICWILFICYYFQFVNHQWVLKYVHKHFMMYLSILNTLLKFMIFWYGFAIFGFYWFAQTHSIMQKYFFTEFYFHEMPIVTEWNSIILKIRFWKSVNRGICLFP